MYILALCQQVKEVRDGVLYMYCGWRMHRIRCTQGLSQKYVQKKFARRGTGGREYNHIFVDCNTLQGGYLSSAILGMRTYNVYNSSVPASQGCEGQSALYVLWLVHVPMHMQ